MEEYTLADRIYKGESIIAFPDTYIVVDIETTGYDTKCCNIIEISAIKIINNEIIDTFSYLVNPLSHIPDFISNLTGITDEMVKDSPTLDFVIPKFKDFVSDFILVGHNVSFDINFLYDSYIRILNEPLRNNFINTLRIARNLFPEFAHHRLKDLAEYFNIDYSNAHRALFDCELTNYCFVQFKKIILNKYGDIDTYINNFHINTSKKKKYIEYLPPVITADTSNPFYDKICVFTGSLEKLLRQDAMRIVEQLGGQCGTSVTKKTNYLILGNNSFCTEIKDGKSSKHKKAELLIEQGQDLQIISENTFYDMIFDN